MPEKVDPKIMAELLAEPGVREIVKKLTPRELALYQQLLIRQGIYDRYVKERQHGSRV